MKRLIHIVLATVFLVPLFLVRLLGQRHRVAKCLVVLGVMCAALFLVDWSEDQGDSDAGDRSASKPKTARERMLAMSRDWHSRNMGRAREEERGESPVEGGEEPGEFALGIDGLELPPPLQGLSDVEVDLALSVRLGEPVEVTVPQELVQAGVTQLGEAWPKEEEPQGVREELPPPLQDLSDIEVEGLLSKDPGEGISENEGPVGIAQRGEAWPRKQEPGEEQQRVLSPEELAQELRLKDQEKGDTIPSSLRAWVDREPERVRDSENGESAMLSQTAEATKEPESSEVAVKTKPLGDGNWLGSWSEVVQPLYLLLLLVLVPILLTKLICRKDWQYRYPAFAMLVICPLLYFLLPEDSSNPQATTGVTQENSRDVLARDRARYQHQSAQVASERDKLERWIGTTTTSLERARLASSGLTVPRG